MGNENEKDQPDSGIDIFNLEPAVKEASGLDSVELVAPEQVGLASKLGPAHFIGLVVLVAGGWIGWPYIFNSSTSTNSLDGSSRVLEIKESMIEASHSRRYAGLERSWQAGREPGVPEVAGFDMAADETSQSASAIGPKTAIATEAPPKEVELQAKVDELQAKLATVEAQAGKCAVQAQASAGMAASRPKEGGSGKHSESKGYRRRAAAASVQMTKDTGFTLNTIYRNQAWIEKTDRTYAVQAGDVIDGIRIIRIEPVARRVVTSVGVIH